MKDGFIRGAAASIDVLVADPKHNCEKILETIQAADARNVKILVCPELVLTAYTCGDIFLHRCLLDEALVGLNHILNETAAIDMLVVLGMPLRVECKLYNCAAFLHNLNSRKIILHFQYSSESSTFLEKRREKCLIFLLMYDTIRLYVNRKQVLSWHWIKRYR